MANVFGSLDKTHGEQNLKEKQYKDSGMCYFLKFLCPKDLGHTETIPSHVKDKMSVLYFSSLKSKPKIWWTRLGFKGSIFHTW